MKERTKVIVDDTTIYEVDLACYESLTPEEKENISRRHGKRRTVLLDGIIHFRRIVNKK